MDSKTIEKFRGCIFGGAIGDAWGSSFENQIEINEAKTFYLVPKPAPKHPWQFTDDTILNLATIEVLKAGNCTPEILGNKFVEYFNRHEIVGIGASTLKAIIDLKAGYHWLQAGRKGEYAAGNGAAMRIAPFAFFDKFSREDIRNFSKLTHNNDEACVGALAIYLLLKQFIQSDNFNFSVIINNLINELPDTNLRDRLIELNENHFDKSIAEIAKTGNNGYVVNSIPFSIFAAFKIHELGFEKVMEEIINSGGDTDTNASLAGQLMGTIVGFKNLPQSLMEKLKKINKFNKIEKIIFE